MTNATNTGRLRTSIRRVRRLLVTSFAAGVPLQDVQDAAGHKDPRTTRRYDRTRLHPDRHPAYVLATHLRRVRTADEKAHATSSEDATA
jgi:hypothetical protein